MLGNVWWTCQFATNLTTGKEAVSERIQSGGQAFIIKAVSKLWNSLPNTLLSELDQEPVYWLSAAQCMLLNRRVARLIKRNSSK